MQSVFGNLPRSGALAPRGSGGGGASSHIGDEARTARTGSTPLWRNGGHWATWLVFVLILLVLWRLVR